MTGVYDPLLVGLSILIAVFGSFTGLRIAQRLHRYHGLARKSLLAGAAFTIGGGIWAMHFIGMLALRLPVTVNYDLLLTLISILVSILVTGIGLFCVSYGSPNPKKVVAGGLFMGSGISLMHYIGMTAIQANCLVTYDWRMVLASIVVGISASTLALWLTFNLTGLLRRVAGAVVMGLAISGMHYTAMAAASFSPSPLELAPVTAGIDPYTLAIILAVASFLLLGVFLLMALPEESGAASPESYPGSWSEPAQKFEVGLTPLDLSHDSNEPEVPENLVDALEPWHQKQAGPSLSAAQDKASQDKASQETGTPGAGAASAKLDRLPVEKNKTVVLLDPEDVVCIQADAHYTRVFDGQESYFCSISLSDLENQLNPEIFLRVHRSHIVNLRRARGFERRREQGVVRMEGSTGAHEGGTGDVTVPVSRANVPRVRAALGLL
ncbi:MHYT domain-containing protein [Rhodovibrionaceae bacterium A322]